MRVRQLESLLYSSSAVVFILHGIRSIFLTHPPQSPLTFTDNDVTELPQNLRGRIGEIREDKQKLEEKCTRRTISLCTILSRYFNHCGINECDWTWKSLRIIKFTANRSRKVVQKAVTHRAITPSWCTQLLHLSPFIQISKYILWHFRNRIEPGKQKNASQ